MRSLLLITPLLAGTVLAAPPKPAAKPQPAASARVAALKAAALKAAALKAAALKRAGKTPPSLGARGGLPNPQRVLHVQAVEGSQVPAHAPGAAPEGPLIAVQTNREYDPRLDLKTDWVAVHGHGQSAEQIEQAIRTWRAAGYPVQRMFFIGSDAGRIYTDGKADGKQHPDEVETDAAGKPITVGDRPYMIPTAGWLEYLKGEIRRAIDAGATGIWPEEPLLHAAGGYSPAFKTAWQDLYQAPWEAPHGSPAAFFRGSRLKSNLYFHAVEELLRYTREYARQKGQDVKFYLPVHSPVGMAGWDTLFPHAAASRLPVDGLVAQVWTGPARTPVTYAGKTGPQVFESSWAMYSYFANLLEGQKEKRLLFLADPVEDDPSFSWPEYERWYKEVLAASLFFPRPDGYEAMPWPERIFLPGFRANGSGAGPAQYRTELSNVMAALKELPQGEPVRWEGATQGVGVVTLDTMMWQRGGPSGSSMRSLHGLTLPLLKRGVPVEIVPGERAGDPGYLSRFKVLLLSYDMQKPLGPEVNAALAEWVKAGGTLILLEGEDPYNAIGEWWSREGYHGPTEHLLRQCGVAVEPQGRVVRHATDRYREVLKADEPVRNLENRRTYAISLASLQSAGKPVFVRFSDVAPADGWGAWVGRVRVRDGGRLRADFVAGSAAERPFLVEDNGSRAAVGHRFADRDASFTYRFSRLGPDAMLEVELGNGFRVSAAAGPDPAVTLQSGTGELPAVQVGSAYPLVTYPARGVEPLYRLSGEDAFPAWFARAGQGSVLYCGLPAAFGADSASGAELIAGLVRRACARAGLAYAEGPLVARRGPYVIGHSLGKTVQLRGEYLDLFQPDLPLLKDPQLPLRGPAFYKEVRLVTRIPMLLHASHRATVLEGTIKQMRLRLEGPKETSGVLRIFRAGQGVASVEAVDASTARPIPVETAVDGATVRIRYPQDPGGVLVVVRWMRPEARLTK